jgi:O-antigen/teichoic acid export membrane protein
MIQTNNLQFDRKSHSPITWLKDRPLLISSALFFGSTTLVNMGNYLFNLILGRWLGPAKFADLSLIVTLMMVTTFATTALSTTTAKFAASYTAEEDTASMATLRSWLGRRAFALGTMFFLFLALGTPFLTTVFQMRSPWSFMILGAGFPIFFMLAIDRGVLQGRAHFGRLALCNQAEMWVRLLGAIGFVAIGWTVNGAVAALPLSFVAAWLIALGARKGLPSSFQPLSRSQSIKIAHYFSLVMIGLIGQIVINNSDILIVKSFFPAVQAGQYAALALIGRMVFFATWAVVMVMFPVVTQKHQKGEPHRFLLWTSLSLIGLVSGGIIIVTLLIPKLVVNVLFGAQYMPIAPLMWLYALATALYALANAVVNYYLSLGNGKGNYLVLLAGLIQVGGLLLLHKDLFIVVTVQLGIMSGLLIMLVVWDAHIKREFLNQKGG